MQAALKVFWEKGYQSCTMDDLCKAMKLNRPSFYHSFGDKKQIYCRLLNDFSENMIQELNKVIETDANMKVALFDFFEWLITLYTENQNCAGCFVLSTAPSEALNDKDIAKLLETMTTTVHHRLQTIGKKAKKLKLASETMSEQAISGILLSLVTAASLRARMRQKKEEILHDSRIILKSVFH